MLTLVSAGTGSNARFLLESTDKAIAWQFVDQDAGLLDRISGVEGKKVCIDFAPSPARIDLSQCDGVTASAVFDLVSEDWFARFVAHVSGQPLLLTLNVDGGFVWQPGDEADRLLTALQAASDDQGWGIRMISGVAAPRFRPFFAHFPPSLARSLRLGARKPGSAKERRKNGGKRAQNGVETGVSDPYIRMPQPWGAPGAGWAGRAGAERRWRCRGCRVSRPCCAAGEENPARRR